MAETQTAEDASSCTRTSTTFAAPDTGNTGPTVTADIGASGKALVIIHADIVPQATNSAVGSASLSVDGATAVAADAAAYALSSTSAGGRGSGDAHKLVTGLSATSHTFAMQYASSTGTATFTNRRITVIPLDAAVVCGTADVVTSETTTSATYTDLATDGPSVTLTMAASGKALVLYTAQVSANAATVTSYANVGMDSPWTIADDYGAIVYKCPSTSGVGQIRFDGHRLDSGISVASHVWKLRYKGGTTSTFSNRRLTVVCLG